MELLFTVAVMFCDLTTGGGCGPAGPCSGLASHQYWTPLSSLLMLIIRVWISVSVLFFHAVVLISSCTVAGLTPQPFITRHISLCFFTMSSNLITRISENMKQTFCSCGYSSEIFLSCLAHTACLRSIYRL